MEANISNNFLILSNGTSKSGEAILNFIHENFEKAIPKTCNKLLVIGVEGEEKSGKSSQLNNFYKILTGDKKKLFNENYIEENNRGASIAYISYDHLTSEIKQLSSFSSNYDIVLIESEGFINQSLTTKLLEIYILLCSVFHLNVRKNSLSLLDQTATDLLNSSNGLLNKLKKETLPSCFVLHKDLSEKGWEKMKKSNSKLTKPDDLIPQNLKTLSQKFPFFKFDMVPMPDSEDGEFLTDKKESKYYKTMMKIFMESISCKFKLKSREDLFNIFSAYDYKDTTQPQPGSKSSNFDLEKIIERSNSDYTYSSFEDIISNSQKLKNYGVHLLNLFKDPSNFINDILMDYDIDPINKKATPKYLTYSLTNTKNLDFPILTLSDSSEIIELLNLFDNAINKGIDIKLNVKIADVSKVNIIQSQSSNNNLCNTALSQLASLSLDNNFGNGPKDKHVNFVFGDNMQSKLEEYQTILESTKASLVQLNEGSLKLEALHNSNIIIQQQKGKIATSSFYEIEEEVVTLKREKLNDYYQLCVKCQTTCCQSCRWPEGALESQCSYFNGGKNCPTCEGKCPKISHIRTNEKVTKVKEKIKRTINNLTPNSTQTTSSNFSEILVNQKSNFEKIKEQMAISFKIIKNSIAKLSELNINELIKNEKLNESQRNEYVKVMQYMNAQAEFFTRIRLSGSVEELFPICNKISLFFKENNITNSLVI